MSPLYVGQRVGIQIIQPGEEASGLVSEILGFVGTSAPTEGPDESGLAIVHTTQTDAESGAAAIRQIAARENPQWEDLIRVDVLPSAG